jgi:hypothetical protein
VDLGGVYLALVEVGYCFLRGCSCCKEYIGCASVDVNCGGISELG